MTDATTTSTDAATTSTAGGEPDTQNTVAFHSGDSEVGWADAMGELSTILAELERDDVDLDVLADRVERAAWLISVCRDRIAGTRLRVDELVSDLVPDERSG
jgi:exodeoxyribonuclease VII small subunit